MSAIIEAGRRFGRYELLCRFATGGMASLYLARMKGAEGFERLVAVKVIHEHLTLQRQFVDMFIDEARIASRISHPNVAMTLDLGRVGNKHFIAMEYVEGESLAAVLRRTAPPIPHAVRIVSDAAAGLHAAHELRDTRGQPLNVVHRDVSPQNILVSYDGAVKVVDFGVARARGKLHTTTDEIKGKFAYMAPEQFSAPETVDRRADVFALGVVLFEATTRRRLFKASTEAETVNRILETQVTPPTQVASDYPRELERIVLRALERDAARRHQTAQQLHDDLERFIVSTGEPVSAAAIAGMMRRVFPDHIENKMSLQVLQSNESETVPTLDLVSDMSLQMEPLGSVLPITRRRRAIAISVGGVALLAVAGAVAVALNTGEPAGAAATTADARHAVVASPDAGGPDTVRLVTIAASASPEGAILRLDGKDMDNPFEIRRPAGQGTIPLVVTARGHETQRFEVPLSKGGTWTVGLRPKPTVRPRKKRRRKKERRTQGRRKQGRRKQGYLDNPYD